MTSPTARTLQALRAAGWTAAVVERRLPRGFVTVDLWGFADVIACHPVEGILLVQCTTAAHLANRLAKVRARLELAAWLAAGGKVEVWGWKKVGRRWRVRRLAVRTADCIEVVQALPRRGRRPRQPELFEDPS